MNIPTNILRAQELRNQVYDLVLSSSIDTLVVTNIKTSSHTTPPHPLAQTCKLLRREFLELYKQDCGKYAKTIQFNLTNFKSTGMSETLKRLGQPHTQVIKPVYELHIHLDNKLQHGRKDFQHMLRTGGHFSPGLTSEDVDLVSLANISFCWDFGHLDQPSAADALHMWTAELHIQPGQKVYDRAIKLNAAFNVTSGKFQTSLNELAKARNKELDKQLWNERPMLYLRVWLFRRHLPLWMLSFKFLGSFVLLLTLISWFIRD